MAEKRDFSMRAFGYFDQRPVSSRIPGDGGGTAMSKATARFAGKRAGSGCKRQYVTRNVAE
jgi:hypothetical protein